MSRDKIELVLVNFWGLGDLIATLYFIKKNNKNHFHIITPINYDVVISLIKDLEIEGTIRVSKNNNKMMLMLEIVKHLFLNKLIIFTAPLSGKSRVFARFISLFSKKVILADEVGNIYSINEEIINKI